MVAIHRTDAVPRLSGMLPKRERGRYGHNAVPFRECSYVLHWSDAEWMSSL